MVGQCINWENLFTTKAMPRYVSKRYRRLPTIMQYSVGFGNVIPKWRVRIWLVAIGVVLALAVVIFVWVRRSPI